MTNDNIVMKIPPNKVTAHKGMDAISPQSSTTSMISVGIVVCAAVPSPETLATFEMTPCTISKIAIIKSIPYTTNPREMQNRRNSRIAVYGRLTSYIFVHVRIIPHKKNNTNNARSMATIDP